MQLGRWHFVFIPKKLETFCQMLNKYSITGFIYAVAIRQGRNWMLCCELCESSEGNY